VSLVETKPGAGVLEERIVGKISGQFVVRAYQRGYRWGNHEVEQLLNDVVESRAHESYYLQPVVVKRIDDGRWELVDGQQRLTTIYLILQYIQSEVRSAQAHYELEYETRPGSQQYLKHPDAAGSKENIDFFHIHQASECVRKWFESQGDDRAQAAIDFHSDLSKRVKVIWYEAPEETDSIDVFTRLNVGRIPLTDAELVKALLLTRSKGKSGGPGRSLEIAAHWDVIERDLRSPEMWAFVTGDAKGQPTHISLLLDAIADRLEKERQKSQAAAEVPQPQPERGGQVGERTPFHTFETLRKSIEDDPDYFWTQVVDLHSLILGWYDDRDIYHKIGYLVTVGYSLQQLVELASEKTKKAFMTLLDDRIRTSLDLSESEVGDLLYDSPKCKQVLVLMNVETIRRMKDSSERYSFQAHASGKWSLEHIHAQNAEALTTQEQWAAWLKLHRKALEGMPNGDDGHRQLAARIDAELERFNQQQAITGLTFRELEQELRNIFAATPTSGGGQVDAIHSISNLALLDSGTNSALSNSVFEVKRRHVLERDRDGAYIPICTRNVFLKYYTTEGAQQIHFWGTPDREAYLEAMKGQLSPYLEPEAQQP
jgi:hypothetical protein